MMEEVREYPHTVVFDLDGTLVENKWPELGDWRPGAVDCLKKLHKEGIHIIVWSCRFSIFTPYGVTRHWQERLEEIDLIRYRFDRAQLEFVFLHTEAYKPSASYYIDDKALLSPFRFDTPENWEIITNLLLNLCSVKNSEFPPIQYR